MHSAADHQSEHQWQMLYRSDNPRDAIIVATTIAAMEFPVQLTTATGEAIDLEEFDPTSATEPLIVRVQPTDHAELTDVLDDLLDEQRSFDAMLEQRNHRTLYWHRVVLFALLIIIAAFAASGVIEL